MLEWIYCLNPENPAANNVHERAQSTRHLPELSTRNVLGKETATPLQCSVGYSAGPGWWQETLIEEGLQNPATKEAKCNT